MKIASVASFFSVLVASVNADAATTFKFDNEITSDGIEDMLILGGSEVPKGQALYTSGLRFRSDARDETFCGGALITDRHVLSAAHCSVNHPNYVAVGTHYIKGNMDGVLVHVKKATVHPKHVNEKDGYDFMVVELDTPVDTTKYKPIKLANASGKDIVDGKIATVMGWGFTAEGTRGGSNVLLKVDVPIIPQATCAKQVTKPIDSSMVCAGGQLNKDACKGDSGGPLIVKGADGLDILIGVVSWGEGCGEAGHPGVYGRVPAVADWIKSLAPGVQFSK